MARLDQILGGEIVIGTTKYTMTEMKYGGQIIWPTAMAVTLTPSWVYGGQYSINAIPAGGGTATATWTLTVTQNGVQVYSGTVTPTTSSITDTTNFSYTRATGVWTANNRGTNGYVSGGTSYPTDYMTTSERYCSLTVTYSGNVPISGVSTPINTSATVQMRQDPNNGYYVNSTYDQYAIALGNYSSSASAAPASGGSTSVSASCRSKNNFIWDSNSTAYYYETISITSFSSSDSWVSVSNGTAYVGSRGTVYGETNRTATITASYGGGSAAATVYQAPNVIVSWEAVNVTYTISGLALTWSSGNASALSAGENGTLSYTSCLMKYYKRNTYSSGESATESTQQSTPITPDYAVSTTYTWQPTLSGSTVTAVKRGKNDTTSRSARVNATYSGTQLGYVTFSQAGTVKTYGLTSNYASGLSLPAYRQEVTPTFTGTTSYDNGDEPDNDNSPSVSFYSGSNVANRISRSGLTIIGLNLGTTEYTQTASTTFTYRWTSHTSATTSIAITQSTNTLSPNGTITIASQMQVPAAGTTLTLTASVPSIWTSGSPGNAITTGFRFAISGNPGNNGKRTYLLDPSTGSFQIGSLEKNEVSETTTTVSASMTGATTGTRGISEAANVKHSTVTGSGTTAPVSSGWKTSANFSGSSSITVPKGQTSQTLTIEAWHNETTQEYTDYQYTWDSNCTPETERVFGTSTTTKVSDLGSVTFTMLPSSVDWIGTGTILERALQTGVGDCTVTVYANGGDARSISLRANGGNSTSDTVNINQKGNIAISVADANGNAVTDLTFQNTGGTQYIYVTSVNTGWSRTLAKESYSDYSPFTGGSVTPSSRSSAGTNIAVKVEIARHTSSSYGDTWRRGTITFTASEDNEVTYVVNVAQAPAVTT